MNITLVDILFFLTVVLFLWKMRYAKPLGKINEDYLSLENCNAMRGLFALSPLLVHIGDSASYGTLLSWWSSYGNLVIDGFFFFTGFGLMKSYILKPGYSKNFLSKRLMKILVPYIIATLVYWAADFVFLGFLYPVSGIFHAIACGYPIVLFSWFIIHLLLFYVFFYILMKVCKNHYLLMVLGGFLYYVGTTVLFYSRGFGMHWYETSLAIPIGMLWAIYEKQIFKFMSKNYWPKFIGTIAISVVVYFASGLKIFNIFPQGYPAHKVIVYALFCICMIFSMMKYYVGNPITKFLGDISFEIYLLHGVLILATRENDKFVIQNDTLFTIAVVAGTIIFAVLMKFGTNLVFKVIDALTAKVKARKA